MPEVVIYTKDYCPYCKSAKALFDSKGVKYIEKDVFSSDKILQEMLTKSGGRTTVPEIFINDKLIGGFDDLSTLEKEGKLDELLK